MLDTNNAARLKEGVRSLDVMSRFALAVMALASGVYTYLGVRSLLDGSATLVFFAAIIYSAAVSVGIYAFWTYMMRFIPLVVSGVQRIALFLTMLVGSVMIIAMSSWLNAAALAGREDFAGIADLHLATDDGSMGFHGLVTDLLDSLTLSDEQRALLAEFVAETGAGQ